MMVEGNWCAIDELSLGFFMAYGNDDNGDFHMLSIGLLIFEIRFIRYIKEK